MPRVLAVLALLVTVLATSVSCGTSQADSPAPQPRMVMVTVNGDAVQPSGEKVDVAVGQPVELVVKSDVEGEIHVHSDPEQEIEFEPGTTSRTLTIERPGLVDVERHDPATLVVQLEVR